MNNLLDEIKITYADCQNDGLSFQQTKHIRRLDWKASEYAEGDMIRKALNAIGEGYNAFEPNEVSDIILKVDSDAKVYVAREGSVCLYIKTSKSTEMIEALDADECDLQQDGLIRAWWD